MLIFLFYILSALSETNQVKVAVIDTGYSLGTGIPLCSSGHKTFTADGTLIDRNGHGTNISALIHKNVKNTDYCQIIIKYYDTETVNNMVPSSDAFAYAISLKPNVINYSSSGRGYNRIEHFFITQAEKAGITIVAAAGNNGQDLDKECDVYLACYPNKNLIIVGNTSNTSNYGKVVDLYVNGNDQTAGGYIMSGTSQSTAIVTGRLISGEKIRGRFLRKALKRN